MDSEDWKQGPKRGVISTLPVDVEVVAVNMDVYRSLIKLYELADNIIQDMPWRDDAKEMKECISFLYRNIRVIDVDLIKEKKRKSR